jgi:cytoskeletal protein RodZ
MSKAITIDEERVLTDFEKLSKKRKKKVDRHSSFNEEMTIL